MMYNIDAISARTYRILTFWMTGSNFVLDQEMCKERVGRGEEGRVKFHLYF